MEIAVVGGRRRGASEPGVDRKLQVGVLTVNQFFAGADEGVDNAPQ